MKTYLVMGHTAAGWKGRNYRVNTALEAKTKFLQDYPDATDVKAAVATRDRRMA